MQIQYKYKSQLSVWEVLSWSRNKNISDKYGSREYPAHGETTVISIALAPQRISWTFHSTPPTRVSAIKPFSSVSQKCWYRQLKSHVWITFINQRSFLNSCCLFFSSNLSSDVVIWSLGVSTDPIFSAVGSLFSLNAVFCGVFTSLMFSAVGCFPLQMVAISIQIGSQHTNL